MLNTTDDIIIYLYIVHDTGAGKTTTFSILTGDRTMTSGTAIIAGYDIRTQLRDVSCDSCEYNVKYHRQVACRHPLTEGLWAEE